jgi:hypothetical protein
MSVRLRQCMGFSQAQDLDVAAQLRKLRNLGD